MRPDLSSSSSYGSTRKPKVKLGPRPSLDVGGRPHTSGATSQYRPVSSLPAGLKLFSRASKSGKDRPKSHHPSKDSSNVSSPSEIPDAMPQSLQPPRPHTSGGRPTSSSGASIKSTPLTNANVNTPKIPTMTPEKARLMKALELRKKQMSVKAAPPLPTEPPPQSVMVELKQPVLEVDRIVSGAPREVHDTLAMLDDMTKEEDSAASFDTSSVLRTDESDATRSDSYPVSPAGASEHAGSTKASSISDSTNETVQEDQSVKADTAILEEGSDNTLRPPTAQVLEKPALREKSPSITLKPLNRSMNIEEPILAKHDEPSLEELPYLLPVTYEPVPSPIHVPKSYVNEVQSSDKDAARDKMEELELLENPVNDQVQSPVIEIRDTLPSNSDKNILENGEIAPEAEIATSMAQFSEASIPTSNFNETAHRTSVAVTEVNISRVSIPTSTFNESARKTSVVASEGNSGPVTPTIIEVKEWKVPRSKFSIQDLKKPTEPSLVPGSTPQLNNEASSSDSPGSPVKTTPFKDEESSQPKKSRGRGLVEPIRTDIDLSDRSGANSANFSSDDDLMDELQDAVFQKAQPISVSKSPISPVFPSEISSPKKKPGNRFSRAFSNPLGKDTKEATLLSPPSRADSSRSVSASAAYLNRINQQSSQTIAKKVNVGSGISQRIKALEKLSSLAPTAPLTPGAAPLPSPAFFAVRAGSIRDTKSPSIAERANSLNRNSPSPNASRESSPEAFRPRDRSSSIKNRFNAFNSSSSSQSLNHGHKSHPESISVTARIIRDPSQPFPKKPEAGKDPMEYSPLDLKQSPLVIDHHKAVDTPPKETIQERRLSTSSKTSRTSKTTVTTIVERRSSITVVRDIISQGRASLSERRRSINLEPSSSTPSMLSPSRPPSTHTNGSPGFPKTLSTRRRSVSSRDVVSPPPTASSSSSVSEEKDKKSSRTSRMMRRMSSSLTSIRKSKHAISPTVREESEPLASPPLQGSQPQTPFITAEIDIGDVNVQFPDTLLWKRRSMVLDSQGYLIVSPAGSDRDKANAGAIRRYHLTSFRLPAIPDLEMQELPNSVILDFLEGGGLQVACEDRGSQSYVLNGMSLLIPIVACILTRKLVLRDAHRNWAAYGQ